MQFAPLIFNSLPCGETTSTLAYAGVNSKCKISHCMELLQCFVLEPCSTFRLKAFYYQLALTATYSGLDEACGANLAFIGA